MSAPVWLLDAINATKSEHVPTAPKPENSHWVHSENHEYPINHDLVINVPTVPSVPRKIPSPDNKPEFADTQCEHGREKILSMLEGQRFALFVNDGTTDPVIATVGIQNVATFELEIPRHSYDGIVLLELIEKHYGEKNANS